MPKSIRTLSATRADVENAHRSFSDPKTGRPVHGSDLLHQSAFSTPITPPDRELLRRKLADHIEEGARRGAFDEGSAAYADQWIEAQFDGWVTNLEDEMQRRRDSAAWILAGRLESVTVASQRLLSHLATLDQLDADLARLGAELRGDEVPAGMPTPRTPESTWAGLANLPAGRSLDGLALAASPVSREAVEPTVSPATGDSAPTLHVTTIHAVDAPTGFAQPARSAD
jgi:hypothetical protein